ncbi:MAG: hypothetical protein V4792_05540 [Pseudomonadota bacterium]
MTLTPTRLIGISLFALALSSPCRADSLTSSASSAGSASVGSLSDSITGSSNASSPGKAVAEGDYRVIEVAELVERPGMLRLALQAAAPRSEGGPIWLTLPKQALAERALAVGDVVNARQRPYGVEFARAAQGANPREAFFLLLADDWRGDLDPRAVTL